MIIASRRPEVKGGCLQRRQQRTASSPPRRRTSSGPRREAASSAKRRRRLERPVTSTKKKLSLAEPFSFTAFLSLWFALSLAPRRSGAALCAAASGNNQRARALARLRAGGRAPVPLTCFPSPRHPKLGHGARTHTRARARSPSALSLSLGAWRLLAKRPGCCQKKICRAPHRFFDGGRLWPTPDRYVNVRVSIQSGPRDRSANFIFFPR